MAEVIVVNPRDLDPYVRVRAALMRPKRALERIGLLMESASLAAFEDQKFGEHSWAPRYPGMAEPFVNIAGAIQDFSDGREEPKARRYDRTPANVDTGSLSMSPKSRVSGRYTVETGSTHPAAALAQWGGVSHQSVDDATKNRIARWILRQAPGSSERARAERLRPVIQPNVSGWDTEVVQRPFLGVPKEIEGEIAEIVEQEMAMEVRK